MLALDDGNGCSHPKSAPGRWLVVAALSLEKVANDFEPPPGLPIDERMTEVGITHHLGTRLPCPLDKGMRHRRAHDVVALANDDQGVGAVRRKILNWVMFWRAPVVRQSARFAQRFRS